MEIDATSSGSNDSNPGNFSGFYGSGGGGGGADNLFFSSLVGKRADFDAYFGKEFYHQNKRDDVGSEKGEGVSVGDRGVDKRATYGGDYGKKVMEEFVEVRNKSNQQQQQQQGGFYNNSGKKTVENEIQLNGVNGFGKKTISFSPDQVRIK